MLGKFRIFMGRIALFCILAVACSSAMSAEDIANSLSERLDFDDGRVIAGQPPRENSGDNDYPQITKLKAPDVILEGKTFEILLETDFDEADDVDGAAVYVENATSYIEVEAEVNRQTHSMKLRGELSSTEGVPGDEYEIDIAMIKGGEAGNYERWKVVTPRSEEDCMSACSKMDGAGCLDYQDIDFEECLNGCEQVNPSLDCYECIDLHDDCEDMWTCIQRECGGSSGLDGDFSYSDGDDYVPDGDFRVADGDGGFF